MILGDIRYLVGIHLGEKGLPPTVIAPTINILSLLDEELTVSGFSVSNTLEKEIERLKSAIILMNYDPADDSEVDAMDDISIEDQLSEDTEDDDDEDDIDFGDDDEE